jgi:hypothetical protein
MRAPALPVTEALAAEMRHVAAVLREGVAPLAPASAGVSIVRTLEAAGESLRRDGQPIAV